MRKEYEVKLNEREYNALFILLSMARVYSWELYDKKEGCKYWNEHRGFMEGVKNHQDKFIQGIMATNRDILDKLSNTTEIDLPSCSKYCKNKNI